MADYSPDVDAAVKELGGVNLPDTIELLEVAGQGSRSIIFKALFRGDTVALKVYRADVVKRYRDKYDLNIAVYEMSQNRKFRKVEALFPFSAKPIMVLGHDGKQSLCFLQEFIEGTPLTELGKANKGLPPSVLEAGDAIARAAAAAELGALDLDYRSVILRQQSGPWLPVIHDFNAAPDEQSGSKGLLGLFRKSHADPNQRLVQEWSGYSQKCAG
jgi:predicted Ser/Thr protein kinase